MTRAQEVARRTARRIASARKPERVAAAVRMARRFADHHAEDPELAELRAAAARRIEVLS